MRVRPLCYTVLFCTAALLIVATWYCGLGLGTTQANTGLSGQLFLSHDHSAFLEHGTDYGDQLVGSRAPPIGHAASCRMDNCFDFSKCHRDFKVYIYPEDRTPSESYQKILDSIRRSKYHTSAPFEACLFVTGVDTLDQDPLSPDYVPHLQTKLHNLPYWNNGQNHIIFNLYSGTWPDYSEHLDIDIGFAMLAKASISTHHFRSGFDISLPLFHKTLPLSGGSPGMLGNINVPSTRKYIIAFKGKRYLTGIGSTSRNILYHIHNNKDLIMLTTCIHGKEWQRYADDRCKIDNEEYDKFDYEDLLANSTFCLVPRGRRLGSFRFLEVLQYGCVPLLLSNNWELPFSEVIDWKQAVVWSEESLIFQIPHVVRSLPHIKVQLLQQQSQFLWNTYFSSIEKIVITTLEIVRDRVNSHNARPTSVWNFHPGAHFLQSSFSRDLTQFPFFQVDTILNYTALIFIRERSRYVRKVMESLASTGKVAKIYLFIVGRGSGLLEYYKLTVQYFSETPVGVLEIDRKAEAFRLYEQFPSSALLIMDHHSTLIPDEVDFAFSVWQEFPERLVGYMSRSYLYHDGQQKYHYTSRLSDEYSIILPDVAFVHKFYAYRMYAMAHSWEDRSVVESCFDLLINFIVSDISKLPPIKVGQRHSYDDISYVSTRAIDELDAKDRCMDTLVHEFGYMPLRRSAVRLDPALFKDQVSILRKQYWRLENLV